MLLSCQAVHVSRQEQKVLFRVRLVMFVCQPLQKYHSPDDGSPSPSAEQNSSPQAPSEVVAPELVHISEKNLSQIESVHGFVSHAHISPVKVGESFILPKQL